MQPSKGPAIGHNTRSAGLSDEDSGHAHNNSCALSSQAFQRPQQFLLQAGLIASLPVSPTAPHAVKHTVPHRDSHTASLHAVELLLFLLYLIIVCDVIYLFIIRKFKPKSSSRRCVERLHLLKKPNSGQVTTKRKRILTLDLLWKRIKAEAQHLQMINARHRAITQTMMESRLHARSLERERSLTRIKSKNWAESDQNIAMVQWAARISADHDPRTK